MKKETKKQLEKCVRCSCNKNNQCMGYVILTTKGIFIYNECEFYNCSGKKPKIIQTKEQNKQHE